MAFAKHFTLACVLVALTGLLVGCSEDTTVTPTLTAEAPMLAPANIRVSVASNGNVIVDWDANTQAHLRGYNVYRLDRESRDIEQLNSTELTTNQYIDGTAEWGNRYDYRVTAISAQGAESSYTTVAVDYRHGPSHEDSADKN